MEASATHLKRVTKEKACMVILKDDAVYFFSNFVHAHSTSGELIEKAGLLLPFILSCITLT